MSRNPALLRALDLASTPSLSFAIRQHSLPDGVLELIKILAEEPTALESAVKQCNCDPRYIRAAAQYYIQQALFFSGADCYRILGVRPGATRQEMRTHMRWLMTWLHPDLAKDDWRSVFAVRVIDAWREAGAPASRSLRSPPRVSPGHQLFARSRGNRASLRYPSTRIVARSRAVPMITGLAICAGLVLIAGQCVDPGMADSVSEWLASLIAEIVLQLSPR